MIQLSVLGAMATVGSSAVLVDTGTEKIVLDYGTKIRETPPLFPIPIQGKVDAVIASHTHLDHIGGIGIFSANGNPVPIYALPVTKPLSELLLLDSIKISREEGVELPFTKADVKTTIKNFLPVSYRQPFKIHKTEVIAFDAGHIPGSMMPFLDFGKKTLLYTGDLNTINTRLLKKADENLPKVDFLITEGTYSDRNHPDRKSQEKQLIQIIEDTLAVDGICFIAGFAVGRCLHPDTYIQKTDGEVVKVKDIPNPSEIISSDIPNGHLTNGNCVHKWMRNTKTLIKVRTRTSEVIVTPEHRMFTLRDGEIKDVLANDLVKNDYLIVPLPLSISGNSQKLNINIEFQSWRPVTKEEACIFLELYKKGKSIEEIAKMFNRSMQTVWMYTTKKRKFKEIKPIPRELELPSQTSKELCQVVGYFLGDGSTDGDKIKLTDKSTLSLECYKKLVYKIFKIEGAIRREKGRNSWYLVINSRKLVKFILLNFPEVKNKEIPKIIQKCSREEVSSFIRGLYDAEGTLGKDTIYFTNMSKPMVDILKFLLLRFGIISFPEKVKSTGAYRLAIAGEINLKRFYEYIGFSDVKKSRKLKNIVKKVSGKGLDYRIPVGKEVYELCKLLRVSWKDQLKIGIFVNSYKKCHLQKKTLIELLKLCEKRILDIEKSNDNYKSLKDTLRFSSAEVARKINDKIRMSFNTLRQYLYLIEKERSTSNQKVEEEAIKFLSDQKCIVLNRARSLLNELKQLLNKNYFYDKVKKVVILEGDWNVYDLTTIPNSNFIANGILVHNCDEILLVLDAHGIDYPVYVDGMAKKAITIINQHKNLLKIPNSLDNALKKVQYVASDKMRKRIVKNPGVILSTSGMLTGGPIVNYIKNFFGNERCSLVLTSFQLEDTPGKKLLETGRFMYKNLDLDMKMFVKRLDFSSHCGRKELFEFVKLVNPEKVFCVHGDHTEEFAGELRQEGFDAVAPVANNRIFSI